VLNAIKKTVGAEFVDAAHSWLVRWIGRVFRYDTGETMMLNGFEEDGNLTAAR
jgi:hypothetical protein